jgi:hypothetical protein
VAFGKSTHFKRRPHVMHKGWRPDLKHAEQRVEATGDGPDASCRPPKLLPQGRRRDSPMADGARPRPPHSGSRWWHPVADRARAGSGARHPLAPILTGGGGGGGGKNTIHSSPIIDLFSHDYYSTAIAVAPNRGPCPAVVEAITDGKARTPTAGGGARAGAGGMRCVQRSGGWEMGTKEKERTGTYIISGW